MRRLAVPVLAAVLLIGIAAPAYAGGRHHGGNTTANVALGLASLAVFNQVMGTFMYRQPVIYERVYVTPAPMVYQYQAAPVVVAPPPPAPPQTVYYPHGRYEFSGQQWVWIPNPPPAPPAAESCRFTGRTVRTPQGVLPECQ